MALSTSGLAQRRRKRRDLAEVSTVKSLLYLAFGLACRLWFHVLLTDRSGLLSCSAKLTLLETDTKTINEVNDYHEAW